MALSINQQVRLRAKSFEFALPFLMEKAVMKFAPEISFDPWLPAEREMGVIFTHVPKSAGTSIVDTLFHQKSRHVPIRRYAAYDEAGFASAFKFTFVRNPWSRIYSAYHYLHRVVGKGNKFVDWVWATQYLSDTPTFEDFVLHLRDRRYLRCVKRYIHFRDQLDWISIPGRTEVMDFVGRFESLESDFAHVCHVLGISAPALCRLRAGTESDYHDAFTGEMVSIVGDMYGRDAKTFGYDFH